MKKLPLDSHVQGEPLEVHLYEYGGLVYELVGRGKLKDPLSRHWIPAMFYRPQGRHGLDQVYARDAREFAQRFKFVGRKRVQ
jgi:hypothetical protein